MIRGYSDHAANERTFLAWVRTGIAVIAFGFVIEKFNLFVLTTANANSPDAGRRLQLGRLSGPLGRYDGLTLLEGEVAVQFLAAVLSQDKVKPLLSSEHFTVDGTLLEAWASLRSFRPKDGSGDPPGPGRNSLPLRKQGASATSTASAAETTRMLRPPTPTPVSSAKDRAKKRGCVSWGTR